METVLNIGVVFLSKESFFAPEKRNERTFDVHGFFVLKPRTLEQTRIKVFPVSCFFDGVVDLVDGISKGDGLVDQSKVPSENSCHLFGV
jgi:hypothetical protein